jgi:hypothetical protein
VRTGLLIGVLVVIGASLWTAPVRSASAGTPLLAGAELPPEVRTILERSCQDCHSERTRYPWYSYVPPVSFLVQRDVTRGRARLNFSQWSEYPLIRRERYLSEIANQVKDGGMPLPIYTLMHRDAKLSTADVDAIFAWTQSERMRLITDPR